MRLVLLVLILMLLFMGMVSAKSDEITAVQASDIIAKIQKGEPVNYSFIAVQGDLNLRDNIDGEKIIVTPIMISDSIIFGSVIFDGLAFQGSVNFERTKFKKGASFIGTMFKGDAIFKDSEFGGKAFFIGSEFNNSAQFQYAEFKEYSDFLGSRFEKGLDFYNSKFDKKVYFRDSVIRKDANFESAIFCNSANFRGCNFESAKFSGVRFNESTDFNYAQFNEFGDFVGAQFNGKLFFNSAKFSNLLIFWDSIKNNLEFNGPTYLILIKNFRDMEQFEDADNCYYQYREEKRQERPIGWAKIFDYLAMISCGYGVRWQNTLLTGIGVLVVFGIYFSLKGGIFNSKNFRNFQIVKESLFFSLTLLLSAPTDWYINLFGIERYKDIVTSNKYSIFLERVIGWSLLILLVNTLSRVMIRY